MTVPPNELELIRAMVKAETWLLKRKSEAQVRRALKLPIKDGGMGLTENMAKKVIDRVYESWREESQHVRMEAHEYLLKTLDHLYTEAFEHKRFETCLGISKLMAQFHGVADTKAKKAQAESIIPEFEGRSEQDIDFYLKNRVWPDEVNLQ